MAQQTVTVTGHLVSDPLLKKISETGEIARFRLASSRRRLNQGTGRWESYDNLYIGVECWGQLARNVKSSLRGGMAVIATGTMVSSEWDDKDGNRQSRIVLKSTHIGVDLSRYTVNSLPTAPLQPVGDKRVKAPKAFDPEAEGGYDEDLTATSASDPAPQSEVGDPAPQPGTIDPAPQAEDEGQEVRVEVTS